MRKLFFIAAMIAFCNAYSQGNTLYSGEMVTPKMGKAKAFENQWKAHLAKFHGKDNSRQVYEILSGDNTGSYLLFDGPSSFADMDKTRTSDDAHDMDFANNVTPPIANISGNNTYRWADTLSYNGQVAADKYITTVYHLKQGKASDLMAEIKRAIKVNSNIKSPASYNTYVKLWSGSKPEIVIMTNLKDGFKQLDNSFSASMSDAFKEAYIKEYGQDQWDKRIKLLPEITESFDVFISKLRKDLSTVMK